MIHILEQIEPGILDSARFWGDGTRSLAAAFQTQQADLDNVYTILGMFRNSIRDLQYEMVETKWDRSGMTLWAKNMQVLSNVTFQIAEVDALFTTVQMLMNGRISHFILPHDTLTASLEYVENHLKNTQRHMTLCRKDHAFYYLEASFSAFRMGNILVLLVHAPVTTEKFRLPFNLHDLIHVPLPTHESTTYYSMLATPIQMLGYNVDLDVIIEVREKYRIPTKKVWLAPKTDSVTILNRAKPSCARGLLEGDLTEIKLFCRYHVYHETLPKSITHLFENTFLLTNIEILHLHCFEPNWTSEFEQTIRMTDIQSLYTFNCHCTKILADQYKITADLSNCNFTGNMTAYFEVHHAVNLAFLSEFFDLLELIHLSADTTLNHSIMIDMPALKRADENLDEKFAIHETTRFDMLDIINSTKPNAEVFDDLSHYLFNIMMKAHGA